MTAESCDDVVELLVFVHCELGSVHGEGAVAKEGFGEDLEADVQTAELLKACERGEERDALCW